MPVLRPRKDGGCSMCNSPEDKVGKGRCVHIAGGGSRPIDIVHVTRGLYQVTIDDQSAVEIRAGEESIRTFFQEMPKLSDEKQREIIKFLEGGE